MIDRRKLKVGDCVETCHLMPAILQSITVFNSDKQEYTDVNEINVTYEEWKKGHFQYDVDVFYPYMKEQYPEYTGGSGCSVFNCGVHRITKKYFNLLTKLGEEKLKILWKALGNAYQQKQEYEWSEFVKLYDRNPIEVMKYIPIKKVIGNGIVQFADDSVWLCKRQMKRSFAIRHEKAAKGKVKYTRFYLPLQKIN